jgi:hypothetical protein
MRFLRRLLRGVALRVLAIRRFVEQRNTSRAQRDAAITERDAAMRRKLNKKREKRN